MKYRYFTREFKRDFQGHEMHAQIWFGDPTLQMHCDSEAGDEQTRCAAVYYPMIDALRGEKSDSKIGKTLDGFLDRMSKDGWIESPRSQSRRYFAMPTANGREKWWSVAVEGNDILVHHGPFPKQPTWFMPGFGGDRKPFSSRDKALAAYHKLIEQKLAKGYIEQCKRKTEFAKRPKASKGT